MAHLSSWDHPHRPRSRNLSGLSAEVSYLFLDKLSLLLLSPSLRLGGLLRSPLGSASLATLVSGCIRLELGADGGGSLLSVSKLSPSSAGSAEQTMKFVGGRLTRVCSKQRLHVGG
jgi:hypothetical protein